MGFVNIGGNNIVHTSTLPKIGLTGISGSFGYTTTTAGTFTIQPQKVTYHLLGEDITIVDGYTDHNVAQTIALINCIGWKYYEEIKKQDNSFSSELEEILETRYKAYLRDKKINNIILD